MKRRRSATLRCINAMLMWAVFAAEAFAYVNDMRITEVDPHSRPEPRVEVVNYNGGAFMLSNEMPIWYTSWGNPFIYTGIVPGWTFYTNTLLVVDCPALSANTDVWLYRDPAFDNPGSIVHGLQFGNLLPNNKTPVAVRADKWPSVMAALPSPPGGHTLAWDGGGYELRNWYIDATPSIGVFPDPQPTGTVSQALNLNGAVQGFESGSLGDEIKAISGWSDEGGGARFKARFVSDAAAANGSTRWLCVKDLDQSGSNRILGPALSFAQGPAGYACSFKVNVELASGATSFPPALALQHHDGDQFQDTWGIQFAETQALLAVATAGGAPAAASIFNYDGATATGEWILIDLLVSFSSGTIKASVNSELAGSLPIDPTGDKQSLRFAYVGSGDQSAMILLLDDLSFGPLPETGAEEWAQYR